MITDRTIEIICKFLSPDIDKYRLRITLLSIKERGYVSARDVRELTCMGIPVFSAASRMLGESTSTVCEYFTEKKDKETGNTTTEITYDDLISLLGFIANDYLAILTSSSAVRLQETGEVFHNAIHNAILNVVKRYFSALDNIEMKLKSIFNRIWKKKN